MKDIWMTYITPLNTRKQHKRLFIYNKRDWDTAEYNTKKGNIFHSSSIWDGPEWGLKGPPRKHCDMLNVYPPPKKIGSQPSNISIWYMRCF